MTLGIAFMRGRPNGSVDMGLSHQENDVQHSLTGIQPSGQVHLGNYLGMIKPALALQDNYAAFYFIADYHALTTTRDPELLRRSSIEAAATFLACGLDPERVVFFRQSAIPEVCELAWILACFTSEGTLYRGHAVKAAQQGGLEINAGTVFYPVLMAADILLYDTHIVPVGPDQRQHVEIARDMAQRINHRFGDDTLVVPEVSIKEDIGLVPGVDGQKMSKSYGNAIPVFTTRKKLRKTIMKIVTDSKTVEEKKDPDTDNVFALYKRFANADQITELRGRYESGGMGYGHAKQALFERVDEELSSARERYDTLMAEPERIESILEDGAVRARAQAMKTLERVRSRVGLS
jgi:tryptophanyl-tRNA synthetase